MFKLKRLNRDVQTETNRNDPARRFDRRAGSAKKDCTERTCPIQTTSTCPSYIMIYEIKKLHRNHSVSMELVEISGIEPLTS